MRVVLIGPPGSGKGTQAHLLEERQGMRRISTGDLLRDAVSNDTPAGREAGPLIKTGKYVSDKLVNDVVADLFRSPDRPTKFVTDGYPRTLAQAEAFTILLLEEGLDLDAVVQLVIPDSIVLQRLCGRWSCSAVDCGAIYNENGNRSKVAGVCDRCGSALYQRNDDRTDIIQDRLEVFHSTTDPLIEHYRRLGILREVSALDTKEVVHQKILQAANERQAG